MFKNPMCCIVYVLGMLKNGEFEFGNYVDVVFASNRMTD